MVTRDSIVQGGPAITDTSEAVLANADLHNRHAWPVTQGSMVGRAIETNQTLNIVPTEVASHERIIVGRSLFSTALKMGTHGNSGKY
ncbi:hypothetical protein CTI12_AA466790 [Artemisia annua]|uniref:Uncharacterized protein n=1 Tax=Artemisia annua TaxID=35608 RepID=A0A2U1LPG5_ARTAN|nr:hypothetical protein CTI12_AA466790 [Artemisia annua]